MAVNGVAVGAVTAGLVLVWSGLKGASVLETIQSIIKGQKPTGANRRPIDLLAQEAADAARRAASAVPSPSPSLPSGLPSGGGPNPVRLPPITPSIVPPAVAPPHVTPTGHLVAPPAPTYPWWDPRGWF